MTRRSRAREVALQLLYQHDHNAQVEEATVREFLQRRLRDPESQQFAETLYRGVQERKPEIDKRLAEVAENWSVERMAAVDRNILRLGAYELLGQPDTPTKVIIDEAIELAKRYGSAESPAFVNGLLDRVATARTSAPRPSLAE
jgi:N utilization substance protein B